MKLTSFACRVLIMGWMLLFAAQSSVVAQDQPKLLTFDFVDIRCGKCWSGSWRMVFHSNLRWRNPEMSFQELMKLSNSLVVQFGMVISI